MRIFDISKTKPGDILEHKRDTGFSVSGILGRLLQIFDPDYDGWGWHLSIAYLQGYDGWYILEATADGVELNYYQNDYLFKDTRVYRWFSEPPPLARIWRFIEGHLGCPYDAAIYFWTGLAILLRRIGIRLPKIIDYKFSCWELAQEFSAVMGKPIIPRYDVVIISDLIKELGVASGDS